MTKHLPTITIAVPTYNRLDLLKRTLESILNQTVAPDEILVLDDRSTEKEVPQYLRSLGKKIKFIENKKNLGNIENINECFKAAKSDYVIVCGSDDMLMPNCVEVFKEKMSMYGNKPAVYLSGGYIIDINDHVTGVVEHFSRDIYLEPPQALKAFWDYYKFHLLIGGWSAWRRDIFKKVGYFGRKYGRVGENEMTMKILPKFSIFSTKEILFAYRFHSQQGLEGQAKNAGHDRGIDEAYDGVRVLADFEKDPAIKKSFSDKEISERIFVRKPTYYFLPISIFYMCAGQSVKGKKLLKVFMETYPKPIISLTSFKLGLGWTRKLVSDWLRNKKLLSEVSGKNVLEIK